MVEMLKNSNALSASISARIRSISSGLDEHGTIVLRGRSMPLSARLPICTSTPAANLLTTRGSHHPAAATLDEIVLINLQQRVRAPETMRLMNLG